MTQLIFQNYATVLPAGTLRDYLIYNKIKRSLLAEQEIVQEGKC